MADYRTLLAPLFITQVIAFYKIKKLRKGLLLILAFTTASVLDMFGLPTEFVGTFILLSSYVMVVYFGIRWSLDWNKRIDSLQPPIS